MFVALTGKASKENCSMVKIAFEGMRIERSGNKCKRRGSRLCRRYCRYAYTYSS